MSEHEKSTVDPGAPPPIDAPKIGETEITTLHEPVCPCGARSGEGHNKEWHQKESERFRS